MFLIITKMRVYSKGFYLGLGTILIETGEAGEVLFWDGWSTTTGYQAIGIGWVPNNKHLEVNIKTF